MKGILCAPLPPPCRPASSPSRTQQNRGERGERNAHSLTRQLAHAIFSSQHHHALPPLAPTGAGVLNASASFCGCRSANSAHRLPNLFAAVRGDCIPSGARVERVTVLPSTSGRIICSCSISSVKINSLARNTIHDLFTNRKSNTSLKFRSRLEHPRWRSRALKWLEMNFGSVMKIKQLHNNLRRRPRLIFGSSDGNTSCVNITNSDSHPGSP